MSATLQDFHLGPTRTDWDKEVALREIETEFNILIGQINDGGIEIDWDQIINTPTTLAGYGITDAYTKTEVDDLIQEIEDEIAALTFADIGGQLAYSQLPTGGGTWANGGALSITGGTVTLGGNLLAGTDATYDFGASGASRYRDGYLSRNLVVGGSITFGSISGTISYSNLPTGSGAWDTGLATTITISRSLTVIGTLTGTLTGNADSATILQNTRTIWGQNFNGSANVTGAFSGATTMQWSGNVLNDLLFTDATYDIGKSGATRPRDIFLSRNITASGTANVMGDTDGTHLIIGPNTTSISASTRLTIFDSRANRGGTILLAQGTGKWSVIKYDGTADVLSLGMRNSSNTQINLLGASNSVRFDADLIFTDATYDIGKSGATRPRDIFTSRNAVFGGTMTATGVAGSFAIRGTDGIVNVDFGTDSGPARGYFGTSSNHPWRFITNNTARLGIDTSNNIGMVLGGKFYVDGVATAGDTYFYQPIDNQFDLVVGNILMFHSTVSNITLGGDLLFTDASFDIGKSGATRPRDLWLSRSLSVAAGGTSIFGHTATVTTQPAVTPNTVVVGTNGLTSAAMAFVNFQASAVGARFAFAHSRGASIGTHTTLNNNDQIGGFEFSGSDGTVFQENGYFRVYAAENHTSSSMATYMQWATNPTGSVGSVVRLRLAADGKLYFGVGSAPNLDAYIYRGGTNLLQLGTNVLIDGTTTLTGNVVSDLKFTDATYDIGKSGATRPRDLFTSRDITVGRDFIVGSLFKVDSQTALSNGDTNLLVNRKDAGTETQVRMKWIAQSALVATDKVAVLN